jgi:hypothetical protein
LVACNPLNAFVGREVVVDEHADLQFQ